MVYYASNHFANSPTWFADKSCVSKGYADKFKDTVYNGIIYNQCIKEHHKKYINDKFAPAWKTIEFMTFGAVIKLFEAIIPPSVKKEVTMEYGIELMRIFQSYIRTVLSLRNVCAHGGVFFDLKLNKTIARGPAGVLNNITKNSLVGGITVLLYMVNRVSENYAVDLQDELRSLLESNLNHDMIAKIHHELEHIL